MNTGLRSVCGLIVFVMVFGLWSSSAAVAGAIHDEFDYEQLPYYVPCLDEEVAGILHISRVLHARASKNGGFHVTSNARQQGELTGLSSGTVWRCLGVSNAKLHFLGDEGTFSNVAPITCVAGGDAPVTVYKFRIVGTVDANLDLLDVSTYVESLTCRGPGS